MTIVCKHCKKDFLTKDKRQKFCSKKCYFATKTGENNFFYGYKPSDEEKKKKAEKCSELFKGSGNPFHGKKHSKETLEKVKEANKKFREENKDLIEQRLLNRLNLDEEKIKKIYPHRKYVHEMTGKDGASYGYWIGAKSKPSKWIEDGFSFPGGVERKVIGAVWSKAIGKKCLGLKGLLLPL